MQPKFKVGDRFMYSGPQLKFKNCVGTVIDIIDHVLYCARFEQIGIAYVIYLNMEPILSDKLIACVKSRNKHGR